MLEIISITEKEKWNTAIKSFPNWDIYYTNEYVESFMLHGSGVGKLVYFSYENYRLCYPIMINDIAASNEFLGVLPLNTYFDIETPYGYGGPLTNANVLPEHIQRKFSFLLSDYCLENGIITQFVRFNPLLDNQKIASRVITSTFIKNTVYMDLSSEATIWNNMDSKNRNMIRKAQRAGISIEWDKGEQISTFIDIYNETMDRDNAEPYYYFDIEYYKFILKNMSNQIIIFYAKRENQIIASSIFFYSGTIMHYHLSGSRAEYRKYAPSNLLLYEAACWGVMNNLKILHLGGGLSNNDSLYGFKKQFNKNGYLSFYVGKTIFNPVIYAELLNLRKKYDLNFISDNNFCIQYKKPKEKNMRVYIIAEAGDNHNGKIELALQLVDAAKDAGADCVKFQTFITDEIISTHAEKADYQKKSTGSKENQYEMLKKLELSFEQFQQIRNYCVQIGICFLSTPFDIPSILFLKEMNMPFWKIPSGEITNLPYLIEIAKTGGDIVLSTGMSTIEEIQFAIEILKTNGSGKISLLHCNTEYPTPFEDVNLNAMETMRTKFRCPVGYSDHTLGIEVPIAAVAMGAEIIEKHFTLDKTMEGPDHQASLEPSELKQMICCIRNIEKAFGTAKKRPSTSEVKNKEIARKSIIAKARIAQGALLTEENLAIKRPGTGLSPIHWFEVIGTKAVRNFEIDEMIEI